MVADVARPFTFYVRYINDPSSEVEDDSVANLESSVTAKTSHSIRSLEHLMPRQVSDQPFARFRGSIPYTAFNHYINHGIKDGMHGMNGNSNDQER